MNRIILAMAIVTLSVPCLTAADFSYEGIYYNILSEDDQTVETAKYGGTDYNGYQGSIVVPSTVTYNRKTYSVVKIGKNSFSSSLYLTSLTIPEGVTEICDNACEQAQRLSSVNIPEGVVRIGVAAFAFTRVTNVSLPSTLEIIDQSAFTSTHFDDLHIPGSVKIIGRSAFNASVWNSITIDEGVEEIGPYAFKDCTYSTLFIPSTVKTIGEMAFSQMYSSESNLATITVDPRNPYFDSRDNCNAIIDSNTDELICGCMNTVIPKTVKGLGNYSFYGAKHLKNLVIPKGVVAIGKSAIDVSNMESLTVMQPNPANISLAGNAINGTLSSVCKLYVPEGSRNLFKAADQWSDFAKIEEFSNSITLVDGEEYTATEDQEDIEVTYTRVFSGTGWYALYLPFDMEYEDWADLGDIAKLNNVYQYDDNGDGTLDRTTIAFDRVTTSVSANTPYVFRPKVAGEVRFFVTNATLKAAPSIDSSVWCASTEKVYTIYGNYTVKEGLYYQGAYALSSSGQFVQAENANQTLKPYRIYMLITDKDYSGQPQKAPARISITVDGETTGIDDIEIVQQIDEHFYDLMGRRVENPQIGIYIHNGKKIYIK